MSYLSKDKIPEKIAVKNNQSIPFDCPVVDPDARRVFDDIINIVYKNEFDGDDAFASWDDADHIIGAHEFEGELDQLEEADQSEIIGTLNFLTLRSKALGLCRKIHSSCDGARELDGVGFSAGDVSIGWATSSKSVDSLTKKATYALINFLTKYGATQLSGSRDWKLCRNGLDEYREFWISRGKGRKFAEDCEFAVEGLREEGRGLRRAHKTKLNAMKNRFVGLSDDGEEVSFSLNPSDFEFRALLSAIKGLDGRRYDGSRQKWFVPIRGNDKTAIEGVIKKILYDEIPENIQKRLDQKGGESECSKGPSDKFVLDVAFGVGVSAGRIELLVKTPPPWDWAWKERQSEGFSVDGNVFKDRLKKGFGFVFDGESARWKGTLSKQVLLFIRETEAALGIKFGTSDEASAALKNINFLLDNGNNIERPDSDFIGLENFRAANGWALRTYQKEGIKFIRSRRASMILDDMGSGKTCQALMSLHKTARAIIVVPASLIKNWEREAALWRPEMRCFVGDLRKGVIEVGQGEIMIVSNAKLGNKSTKAVLSQYENLGENSDWVLIADECKAFKNEKSIRTIAMARWTSQVLMGGGRICGMDGTPITNTPTDLYIQQNVFGVADLTWDSFESFVDIYGGTFEQSYSRRKRSGSYRAPKTSIKWDVNPPSQKDIVDGMAVASLRRNKSDLMPWLPPQQWVRFTIASDKINTALDLAIEQEADEVIGRVEDGFGAERAKFIETLVGDGESGGGPNIGSISRLRKLLACSKVQFVADEAIAFIRSAHFSEGRERLVVMTSSAAAAEVLFDSLEGVDGIRPALIYGKVSQKVREQLIESFQGDSKNAVNVIIATIGAAGQGINLTNANTMFFVDWDWSHAMNEQAEARTHRSGLVADKALYVNFVVDHWLDERVAAACGVKQRYHETIKQTAVKVKQSAVKVEHEKKGGV